MEEMKLTKKAYLRHEVQHLLDVARYEELNVYFGIYDRTGRFGKERLAELKNRLA